MGTLKSAQFAALLDKFAGTVQVITQPAPGLVECVEAGDLDGPETRRLVENFVHPLLLAEVDVIVLGCTHYPFLAPLIQSVAGPQITLIDTGGAVARQVESRLREAGLLQTEIRSGDEQFFTTGDALEADKALNVLWPGHSPVRTLPSEVAILPSHANESILVSPIIPNSP